MIVRIFLHHVNIPPAIVVNPSSSSTSVKFSQLSKIDVPRLVTLPGILTLVNPLQL